MILSNRGVLFFLILGMLRNDLLKDNSGGKIKEVVDFWTHWQKRILTNGQFWYITLYE